MKEELLFLILTLFLTFFVVKAQVTTAAISGKITDASSELLIGVTKGFPLRKPSLWRDKLDNIYA